MVPIGAQGAVQEPFALEIHLALDEKASTVHNYVYKMHFPASQFARRSPCTFQTLFQCHTEYLFPVLGSKFVEFCKLFCAEAIVLKRLNFANRHRSIYRLLRTF
jgi:hypothetical protein